MRISHTHASFMNRLLQPDYTVKGIVQRSLHGSSENPDRKLVLRESRTVLEKIIKGDIRSQEKAYSEVTKKLARSSSTLYRRYCNWRLRRIESSMSRLASRFITDKVTCNLTARILMAIEDAEKEQKSSVTKEQYHQLKVNFRALDLRSQVFGVESILGVNMRMMGRHAPELSSLTLDSLLSGGNNPESRAPSDTSSTSSLFSSPRVAFNVSTPRHSRSASVPVFPTVSSPLQLPVRPSSAPSAFSYGDFSLSSAASSISLSTVSSTSEFPHTRPSSAPGMLRSKEPSLPPVPELPPARPSSAPGMLHAGEASSGGTLEQPQARPSSAPGILRSKEPSVPPVPELPPARPSSAPSILHAGEALLGGMLEQPPARPSSAPGILRSKEPSFPPVPELPPARPSSAPSILHAGEALLGGTLEQPPARPSSAPGILRSKELSLPPVPELPPARSLSASSMLPFSYVVNASGVAPSLQTPEEPALANPSLFVQPPTPEDIPTPSQAVGTNRPTSSASRLTLPISQIDAEGSSVANSREDILTAASKSVRFDEKTVTRTKRSVLGRTFFKKLGSLFKTRHNNEPGTEETIELKEDSSAPQGLLRLPSGFYQPMDSGRGKEETSISATIAFLQESSTEPLSGVHGNNIEGTVVEDVIASSPVHEEEGATGGDFTTSSIQHSQNHGDKTHIEDFAKTMFTQWVKNQFNRVVDSDGLSKSELKLVKEIYTQRVTKSSTPTTGVTDKKLVSRACQAADEVLKKYKTEGERVMTQVRGMSSLDLLNHAKELIQDTGKAKRELSKGIRRVAITEDLKVLVVAFYTQ